MRLLLRLAADPMSHTHVYDDTTLGEGCSSPTNPMIDPIDFFDGERHGSGTRLGRGPRVMYKRTNPVGPRFTFGEHGVKGVPDMNHIVPYFKRALHAICLGFGVELRGVVEQDFIPADMNKQGR